MPVNKGLKTLANNAPNFSNAAVSTLINSVLALSWIPIQKTMVDKSIASEILTNTDRTALQSALNAQAHLNINDWLPPLSTHTQAILSGTLGEANSNGQTTFDYNSETGTFLDHLSSVQNFISSIPNLYDVTADSLDKGISGHFGSLAGTLDSTLIELKSAIDLIVSHNLSQNTAYQTALQNVSDYIDTLFDSTAFSSGTWSSLMSSLETAGNNFNTALAAGHLAATRNTIVTAKSTIENQITLETANLGSIRTYEDELSSIYRYLNFAGDTDISKLLVRASQNANWKSYFQNYDTNFQTINPLFVLEPTTEQKINKVLALRGLPDVTQYLDLESVAKKALRDTRLASKVKNSGRTAEQVITDSCILLAINTVGRNVYTLSKILLKNMNDHDRDLVAIELSKHTDTNTIS